MVLAARRAYSDATRWIKEARAKDRGASASAFRRFGWTAVVVMIPMTLLGLTSPSTFGQVGTESASGWPALVLIAAVGACTAAIAMHRAMAVWLIARLREPFARPLREHPAFEGAVGALSACPAPYRARFALAWVWGPAFLATAGAVFATSTSYFVVDAVLARGAVDWGHPVLAAGNALLGLASFRLAHTRLDTWRIALSVHRAVSGSY